MNVLVACEESQAVCIEFRKLGHNAFSCDLQPCSGGHPEWHLQMDVLQLLEYEWDLIIAFPPCTYLTVTGNRWFNIDKYGESAQKRYRLRDEAANFFMQFANSKCPHVAIENPIGYMSTYWRKPDQIIHPYYFAEFDGDINCESKATCLWLKGLPNLVYHVNYQPRIIHFKNGKGSASSWLYNSLYLPKDQRSFFRSKTYPGVARAMAEQWSDCISFPVQMSMFDFL